MQNPTPYLDKQASLNHLQGSASNGVFNSESEIWLINQVRAKIIEAIENGDEQWLSEFSAESLKHSTNADIIYDYKKLNGQRYLNRYFIAINKKLKDGGFFICSFECARERKRIIYQRSGRILGSFFYFFDFIWNRACPKLLLTKKFYFWINKKVKRVYPLYEIMGRLYFCGFEMVNERLINGTDYILARKIGEPSNDLHPSFGLIIKLNRIGKDGKLFPVYKIRTMYAYSEYLQSYVYEHNNLDVGGKFANDFRISDWGKKLRKYFIDEIPMIHNILIDHNMKLVGVRPLSPQYYSLYTPEMQQYRIKTKPGLLPPFYVDFPETIEEIQASEKKYLDSYFKHPYRTDFVYFFKILFNIIFRRKKQKAIHKTMNENNE